jgi:hypothetical protein
MTLALYLDQAQRGTWWFDRAPSAGNRKLRRALAAAERRVELLSILERDGPTLLSDIAEETEETVQSVRSLALPMVEEGILRRVVMEGGYVGLEVVAAAPSPEGEKE